MRFVVGLLAGWILSAGAIAGEANELEQVNALIGANNFSEAVALLEPFVKEHPSDQRAVFTLARLYSWQQRWDDSLSIYNGLLTEHPDNVDYQLGKGQALFWQGDYKAAYLTLDSARLAAPAYEQVWQNELQALERLRSDSAYADKWAELKIAAAQRFPNSNWAEVSSQATPIHQRNWINTYDGSAGYETLGAGRDPWRRTVLGVTFANVAKKSLKLIARSEQRFGLTDSQFEADYTHPLKRATVSTELLISPSAQVLPEAVGALALQTKLFEHWTPALGYRYSAYSNSGIHTLNLGAETYWKNVFLSYQTAAVFSNGYSVGNNHRVQAIAFYGSENRVGLLLLKGTEIERLGAKTTLKSDVTAATANMEHWANKTFAFTAQINGQRQGSLYTRYGLEFGLRYRP